MEKSCRKFLVSPYLFLLTALFGVMMLGSGIYLSCMFYKVVSDLSFRECFDSGWFAIIVSFCAMYIILLAIYYKYAYEYFGIVILDEYALILKAPFRKVIIIYYKDIVDIGIDYGILSGSKQFWIYISVEKISPQYLHQLNRLPISCKTIRIQYNESVYNSLISKLPSCLRKQLSRCVSVIRLHSTGGGL